MKGFTFLELLVSIAIVGILAGLAAPSFQEQIAERRISNVHSAMYNSNITINVTTRAPWTTTTVQSDAISIEPRGRSSASTIVICDYRCVTQAKSMSVLTSGIPNDALSIDDSGNTIDVWSELVTCT